MANSLKKITQTKLQIFALIFLLLLHVTPASAACLNWSWLASNPSYRLVYEGTLGDHPIRMMLHLNSSTGRFDGAYGYNDQPKMLSLTGSMQLKSTEIYLDEREEKDQVTGHFILSFFHPRPTWESQENYEKKNKDTCEFLTGSWQSSDGNARMPVSLRANGEISPEDDLNRAKNEATAYKLRRAMLNKDRNAFASLLHYPFHSQDDHYHNWVWSNPEEVIRNYDKIIFFWQRQIESSVPHILQSAGPESIFMDRSIYLRSGKVTWICAGACPVVP